MAEWWMLCCGFVVIRDVVAGIIFMHTGVLLPLRFESVFWRNFFDLQYKFTLF